VSLYLLHAVQLSVFALLRNNNHPCGGSFKFEINKQVQYFNKMFFLGIDFKSLLMSVLHD